MSYKNLKALALSALLVSSVPAFSKMRTESGGGGASIVCKDSNLSHVSHVYLADTFDLIRSGKLKKLESTDRDIAFNAAVAILKIKYPKKSFKKPNSENEMVDLAWMLQYTKDNLQYNLINPEGTYDYLNIKTYDGDSSVSTSMPTKGDRPLVELGDDHILKSELPNNCEKRQIAVQEINKMAFTLDLILQGQMTRLEEGLLRLHEALVSIRNIPGADTTPIRKMVHSVVEDQALLSREINKIKSITDNRTLKALPENLVCDIVSESNNDFKFNKPSKIEIKRTSGDGSKDSNNTFSLVILKNATSASEVVNSYNEYVNIDPSIKLNSGSLDVRIAFGQYHDIYSPSVFLRRYNEYTGSFSGSIEYSTPIQRGGHIEKYTDFGISCHVAGNEKIEFNSDNN